MQAVQGHYRDHDIQAQREQLVFHNAPTDVELECLAKLVTALRLTIFAAKIHHVDTVTGEDEINSCSKPTSSTDFGYATTSRLVAEYFHDNSGVIEWTKVEFVHQGETHNSQRPRSIWWGNDWNRGRQS